MLTRRWNQGVSIGEFWPSIEQLGPIRQDYNKIDPPYTNLKIKIIIFRDLYTVSKNVQKKKQNMHETNDEHA